MKYTYIYLKTFYKKNSNSTIAILQVSNVWFNRRQPDSQICSYSQYSFEMLTKKHPALQIVGRKYRTSQTSPARALKIPGGSVLGHFENLTVPGRDLGCCFGPERVSGLT